MIPVVFDPHIRPINLRRDLVAIADLIEVAFAGQMDVEGREYLHHIRQVSRSLGGYIMDGTTPETSQLPFQGYLWEEDGRIIGNLTLILVRKQQSRTYFIANVAVLPEHRGRGIARQLTDRAIAHVQAHQGRRIYLQVRADNNIAQHIYRSSGFEDFSCRTTWVFSEHRRIGKAVSSGTKVTRRNRADWPQQKEWLNQTYPSEISWNLPFSLDRLKPDLFNNLKNFLNGFSTRTWSARQDDRLIGVATWESGFTGSDYVWLATSPAWEDDAIRSLIPVITTRVFRPQKLMINYPVARGSAAFSECGMRELNTLVWMKKEIPLDYSPVI